MPSAFKLVLAASAVIVSLAAARVAAQPTDTPAAKPTETQPVQVLMQTSMGDIVLELDPAKAPASVDNFLAYVDRGEYDGTIFHRVIENFMIQGGGFTPDMKKKPTRKPIVNEWRNGLKNKRGTIAMARLSGNPDSATNQFFINVEDNPGLDSPQPRGDGAAYAVFGKVVKGMEVVDKIRAVPTTNRAGHQNVPVDPVTIVRARRLGAEDAPGGAAPAPKDGE